MKSAPSRLRVYLVRHAAAERTAAGGDAARALTPEGRVAFQRLAGSLLGRLEVARVIASPFTRARQTGELLATATRSSCEEDEALTSGRMTGSDLLEHARRVAHGTALVGHNPEVAEATALAAGRPVKVRPGTIAALDFWDGGDGKGAGEGGESHRSELPAAGRDAGRGAGLLVWRVAWIASPPESR